MSAAGTADRLAAGMAVHFIHVPKSGGSALRYAIREARRNNGGKLVSPWGPIRGHDHRFRFRHVEDDEKAVFALRDPVSRFVSAYHSRRRKGAPRYWEEWSDAERLAFEWFPTAQDLADGLAEPGEVRERATLAMRSIRHLKRPMTYWVGKPAYMLQNLDKILYIARQETLDEDWEKVKKLLDIPRDQMLPHDAVNAHRTTYEGDMTFSEKALDALRVWYADDYRLLEIAEEVRSGRAPARDSPIKRLASLASNRRLSELRARISSGSSRA